MTKPTLFRIVYDNPAAVYKPGDVVKGTVNLDLPEDLKIHNVKITLIGTAQVKWTKGAMFGGGGGGVLPFKGDEVYFKKKFLPEGDSKDGQILSAGVHTYTFEIKLPDNLPSSFEHKVGKIRYWTECYIDRKTILKAFNYSTRKAFSVISVYDLNTLTDVLGTFENAETLSVGCLCCAGVMDANIKMNRKAFVPGELMTFDAQVSNTGSFAITKTETVLKQVIKFITSDYESATKRNRVIRRLEHGPIPSKGILKWVNEGFVIPPLPPTELLKKCRIIKISYVLELNVNPTEVGTDITLPLDIIIGNIPLKESFDEFNKLASKANVLASLPTTVVAESGVPSSYEAQGTAPGPLVPSLPNCPPPTYHESVFGTSTLKDEDDDGEMIGPLKFAPVYLTYHYDDTQFEIAKDE